MKKVQFYNGETHDNFRGFLSSVKSKYGDKVLFRTKTRRKKTEITYNQFYSDVCRMAHYFSTTYGTGKTISLIGENSYEWILSYFAVSCSSSLTCCLGISCQTHPFLSVIRPSSAIFSLLP